MTGHGLVSLLHLCDTLFPTGGYAHSDGLETAAADGRVVTGADFDRWLEACLQGSIATCDGPAVMTTVRAVGEERWADVRSLDDEIHALRPSSAGRRASRNMGSRLLATWAGIHPEVEPVPNQLLPPAVRLTLPVAFGAVCAVIGITPRAAVEAFAYTRLAAAASCAMRVLPIGQHEMHARLASALARVPEVAGAVERRVARGDRPASFTPALDLAAMGQQYVHSRLFLS